MGLRESHRAIELRLRVAGAHGAVADEVGELWPRLGQGVPAAPRVLRKRAAARHRATACTSELAAAAGCGAVRRVERRKFYILGVGQADPDCSSRCACIRVIRA